jgi:hypothetical protein
MKAMVLSKMLMLFDVRAKEDEYRNLARLLTSVVEFISFHKIRNSFSTWGYFSSEDRTVERIAYLAMIESTK